ASSLKEKEEAASQRNALSEENVALEELVEGLQIEVGPDMIMGFSSPSSS
ncbi:hypothetical protein A2U01_0100971, partial [Trifolium medium]|nr:hypothetical protein [Trifolium medium]